MCLNPDEILGLLKIVRGPSREPSGGRADHRLEEQSDKVAERIRPRQGKRVDRCMEGNRKTSHREKRVEKKRGRAQEIEASHLGAYRAAMAADGSGSRPGTRRLYHGHGPSDLYLQFRAFVSRTTMQSPPLLTRRKGNADRGT